MYSKYSLYAPLASVFFASYSCSKIYIVLFMYFCFARRLVSLLYYMFFSRTLQSVCAEYLSIGLTVFHTQSIGNRRSHCGQLHLCFVFYIRVIIAHTSYILTELISFISFRQLSYTCSHFSGIESHFISTHPLFHILLISSYRHIIIFVSSHHHPHARRHRRPSPGYH